MVHCTAEIKYIITDLASENRSIHFFSSQTLLGNAQEVSVFAPHFFPHHKTNPRVHCFFQVTVGWQNASQQHPSGAQAADKDDFFELLCLAGCDLICLVQIRCLSKGKVGYPWESTRDVYQHVPPIDGLCNGCIGQYGVMFWKQLLGYPPKGTQIFPLIIEKQVVGENYWQTILGNQWFINP